MDNIQQELIALKEEIRDLKTAQTIPSVLKTYHSIIVLPAGSYSGVYTWTIRFADHDSTNAPLVYVSSWMSALPYRDNNTIQVEWYSSGNYFADSQRFDVYSSKPIYDIQPNF